MTRRKRRNFPSTTTENGITALLSNEINHPSRPLHRLFAEQLLHVLLREGLLDQALQETD